MNKTYRLLFNKSLGVIQVVSELAKSRGKKASGRSASLGIVRNAVAIPFQVRIIPAALALSLVFISPSAMSQAANGAAAIGINPGAGGIGVMGAGSGGNGSYTNGYAGGGGGGGGGPGNGRGGAGGNGNGGSLGGAGGSIGAPGINGAVNANSGGGGGGGGGAGFVGSVISGNITGGNGGNAIAYSLGDGTGGGGGGGVGLLITGTPVLNNSHTITGGTGGNGGSSAHAGGGGAGIYGIGFTLTSSGTVVGGSGGGGYIGGAGGAGVIGAGFNLINTGMIAGYNGGASSFLTSTSLSGAGVTGSNFYLNNRAGGSIAGGSGTSQNYYGGNGGAGVSGAGLTLINSGRVSGGGGGNSYLGYQPLSGGNGGAGVFIAGGTTNNISNNSIITGGAGGNGFYGGNGGAGIQVLSGANVVITNSSTGSITGGYGGRAGGGVYGVTIAGFGGAGISISGAGVSITNSGSIAGGAGGSGYHGFSRSWGAAGGDGIDTAGSGIVIIANSGSIAGGAGGAGYSTSGGGGVGGPAGAGISVVGSGTTTINNGSAGSITGGAGGSAYFQGGGGAGVSITGNGATTITNRGTIVGGAGYSGNAGINIGSSASGSVNITNQGTILSGTSSRQSPAANVVNNSTSLTSFVFSNAQSGLTFSGTLPTNYNIIVNSTTNYGQFSVTSASGPMAFGIYAGGATGVPASTLTAHTYADVLQGFTNLNSVTNQTGTYNGLTYSLVADPLISGDWNLVVANLTQNYTPNVIANNNPAAVGAANSLTTAANNSTPGLGGVITTLNGLSGAAQSNAISQTLPTVVGSSSLAAASSQRSFNQIIQARQNVQVGLSSGEDFIASGDVWLKGFGNWANQNDQGGVSGYKVTGSGLAIGADHALSPRSNIGAVFAFGNSSVTGNNTAAPSDVTVASYQAGVYGDYAIDPVLNWNYQADAGFNNNQESRNLAAFAGTTGVTGTTASASYNSVSEHIGTGLRYLMPLTDSTNFLPALRVDYTSIQSKGYTENGAGSLNLNVNSQTYNELLLGADLRVDQELVHTLKLSANVGVGYNTLNNQVQITSSYMGGGSSFVTNGLAVSPWLYNAGLGLSGKLEKNMELAVRYDVQATTTGYTNQMASAKLKVFF